MLSLGVVKLILAARNAPADPRVLAGAHIVHITEKLSSLSQFAVHFCNEKHASAFLLLKILLLVTRALLTSIRLEPPGAQNLRFPKVLHTFSS